jgi:hypothetical protein
MYFLVQANDVKEAYDNTIETMKGTMRLHYSSYCRVAYYGRFSILVVKRMLEQLEKFIL